jgi:hypothetical protein
VDTGGNAHISYYEDCELVSSSFCAPFSVPLGEKEFIIDELPLGMPGVLIEGLQGLAEVAREELATLMGPEPIKQDEKTLEKVDSIISRTVAIDDEIENGPVDAPKVLSGSAGATGLTSAVIEKIQEPYPTAVDKFVTLRDELVRTKDISQEIIQRPDIEGGMLPCNDSTGTIEVLVPVNGAYNYSTFNEFEQVAKEEATTNCQNGEVWCSNEPIPFCADTASECFICDPWDRCAMGGYCVEDLADCSAAQSCYERRFYCKSEAPGDPDYCSDDIALCDENMCDSGWMECFGRCVVENRDNDDGSKICPPISDLNCEQGEYECMDSFEFEWCAATGDCDPPLTCQGGFFAYHGVCIPDLAFSAAPLVCAEGEYACTTGELLGPSGDWICGSSPLSGCFYNGVNCTSGWFSYKDRCIHESDVQFPPDIFKCSSGQYVIDCAGMVYCSNQPLDPGC